MSEPSATKRGLTLGWSIGLGIVLLVLTGAVLLPSTKRAGIRFDERPQTEEGIGGSIIPAHAADEDSTQSEDEALAPKDTAPTKESVR